MGAGPGMWLYLSLHLSVGPSSKSPWLHWPGHTPGLKLSRGFHLMCQRCWECPHPSLECKFPEVPTCLLQLGCSWLPPRPCSRNMYLLITPPPLPAPQVDTAQVPASSGQAPEVTKSSPGPPSPPYQNQTTHTDSCLC